jgi:hypothetical protein
LFGVAFVTADAAPFAEVVKAFKPQISREGSEQLRPRGRAPLASADIMEGRHCSRALDHHANPVRFCDRLA